MMFPNGMVIDTSHAASYNILLQDLQIWSDQWQFAHLRRSCKQVMSPKTRDDSDSPD